MSLTVGQPNEAIVLAAGLFVGGEGVANLVEAAVLDDADELVLLPGDVDEPANVVGVYRDVGDACFFVRP